MATLDKLVRLSFAGIEFPFERIQVTGEVRKHTHEFAFVDYGEVEKLGLRNYTIAIDTKFADSYVDPRWAKNFPDDLDTLISFFERKVTRELVIPGMGTMRAYCTNWDRTIEVRHLRNGQIAKLRFEQDEPQTFSASAVIQASQSRVAEAGQTFFPYFDPGSPTNPFDGLVLEDRERVGTLLTDLRGLVDGFGSIRDQAQLYSSAYHDRSLAIASMCQAIEDTARFVLDDPRNHKASAAVRELWSAALTAAATGQNAGIKLISWVNTKRQSVGAISEQLYGTTSRGTDILRLNPIDDALRVPAKMRLRVADPKQVAEAA